jgi:hypothetical protein
LAGSEVIWAMMPSSRRPKAMAEIVAKPRY